MLVELAAELWLCTPSLRLGVRQFVDALFDASRLFYFYLCVVVHWPRVSVVSSFIPAINEFVEISEALRMCVGRPLTFIILTVVTSSPPPLVLIFLVRVSDWSRVALDLG